MKVLILGATGFIGNPAAKAFVAAGHQVYGQTRSASSAKTLQADEITPVVGDPAEVESWLPKTISSLKVDVIIDAFGGSGIAALGPKAFEVAKKVAEQERPHGPGLTYIYCSGTWVHGDNRDEIVTDSAPVSPSTGVPLTSWRIPLERAVTSSTSLSLNGIVVRPSLLYGRSGSILASVFKSAHEGKVEFPGVQGGGGRTSFIHQDDLARAFVLAAEKGPVAKGLVFDVTEGTSVGIDDFLAQLVKVSGAKSYTYTSTEHPFMFAVASSQRIRPTLARSVLGWEPRKTNLVDGLEVYYAAWKAAEGLE